MEGKKTEKKKGLTGVCEERRVATAIRRTLKREGNVGKADMVTGWGTGLQNPYRNGEEADSLHQRKKKGGERIPLVN